MSERAYEVEVRWKAREGFVRVRTGLSLREARGFKRDYQAQGFRSRVIKLVRKAVR